MKNSLDTSPRAKEKIAQAVIPEISIKFVAVAALFLFSLFLFALLVHEAVLENEDLFDSKASSFFSNYATPPVIRLMKFFTFFGSTTFLFPAYFILCGYFLLIRKPRYTINIAIIGLTSTGLMYALKQFFHRKRPELPLIQSLKTFSFPSGHTLSSFIFCSVLIYLTWKAKIKKVWKWIFSILLILFSVMIGISRIMLNVHFASDVVAGLCLGLAWAILSFWLLQKLEKGRNNTR